MIELCFTYAQFPPNQFEVSFLGEYRIPEESIDLVIEAKDSPVCFARRLYEHWIDDAQHQTAMDAEQTEKLLDSPSTLENEQAAGMINAGDAEASNGDANGLTDFIGISWPQRYKLPLISSTKLIERVVQPCILEDGGLLWRRLHLPSEF